MKTSWSQLSGTSGKMTTTKLLTLSGNRLSHLGPRATRYGVRRSPVFVGEVNGFHEVVHYIAPHWNDAPQLLSGLRDCAERTAGGSALVRAAVLSFGFVYIHPPKPA